MTRLLLLFNSDMSLTYFVLWTLGVLVFIGAVVLLFSQRRVGHQLKLELAELDKVRKDNIEYELVLKAMRLSTWRLDIATGIVTFENDYRGSLDKVELATGIEFSNISTMLDPADAARVEKSMHDLCSGEKDFYHELYCVVRQAPAKSYWEESYATVSERDAEGNPTAIVGTTMNVDERKQMEQALIRARNKAEESDRLKTAFLANMSHEIRTPLNAIVGFADLLPVVQDDDSRNQLIGEIQKNNRKLLNIVDGLMSMSKVEAEAASVEREKVELSPLIEQLVATHRPTTTVTMNTSFPETAATINTDRAKLTEIIDKLLQNAVKFTGKGLITAGYDEPRNGRIRLWVHDTGVGVADADKEKIFERFYKVDEYIPGTGLGLSVCKSHAKALGGSIGVESQLGTGSLFWVELPV